MCPQSQPVRNYSPTGNVTVPANWERFVDFRREVSGSRPDGTACEMVIELADDGAALVVRLESEGVFTVCLAVTAVGELITAVSKGETSYVSAFHATYGRRLLDVHPHVVEEGAPSVPDSAECGSVELYLELPDDRVCELTLDTVQAARLVCHLAAGWRLIQQPQLEE